MATSKTKIATRHLKRLKEISNALKNLLDDIALDSTLPLHIQEKLGDVHYDLDSVCLPLAQCIVKHGSNTEREVTKSASFDHSYGDGVLQLRTRSG